MKLLCMSDIHCQFDRFRPESLPDADLCLVAGDLTNYGHDKPQEVRNAMDWLAALGKRFPTYWIPGNHDIRVVRHVIDPMPDLRHVIEPCEPEGVHCLLDTPGYWRTVAPFDVGFEHLSLVGVSCSTAYDIPLGAWDYTVVNRTAENMVYAALPPADIVVSHCPPKGCTPALDYAGYDLIRGHAFIGSEALYQYIETHQPKLVVCGHCHTDGGKEAKIGTTRVVNVAQQWKVIEVDVS